MDAPVHSAWRQEGEEYKGMGEGVVCNIGGFVDAAVVV